MIKVNYDTETGKVVSFNKDTKPYIEITEEQRRQPLPNKFSWYAVEDGEFVIKTRQPTEEEVKQDLNKSIIAQINELKANLVKTDYKAIKFAEGEISEENYAEIRLQRRVWREEINNLEQYIE